MVWRLAVLQNDREKKMKIAENSQKYKIIAFNEKREAKFFGTCFKEELPERLRVARESLESNWGLCIAEILFKKREREKEL